MICSHVSFFPVLRKLGRAAGKNVGFSFILLANAFVGGETCGTERVFEQPELMGGRECGESRGQDG